MGIARAVQKEVENMPAGQVFGYQALSEYTNSSTAVVRAVNRLVEKKKLSRFSSGKFYVPKTGLLGAQSLSDNELIRATLYKNGKLRGYVTGLALFNQLGLTTQIPSTITLAINGGKQEKKYSTIRIRTVVTPIRVSEEIVPLLQYLDVLKDLKKIPDSDPNVSLKIVRRCISELSRVQKSKLASLATNYYGPQVRALTGMLLTRLQSPLSKSLALSLNPITVYKLNIDADKWPEAKDWNIV